MAHPGCASARARNRGLNRSPMVVRYVGPRDPRSPVRGAGAGRSYPAPCRARQGGDGGHHDRIGGLGRPGGPDRADRFLAREHRWADYRPGGGPGEAPRGVRRRRRGRRDIQRTDRRRHVRSRSDPGELRRALVRPCRGRGRVRYCPLAGGPGQPAGLRPHPRIRPREPEGVGALPGARRAPRCRLDGLHASHLLHRGRLLRVVSLGHDEGPGWRARGRCDGPAWERARSWIGEPGRRARAGRAARDGHDAVAGGPQDRGHLDHPGRGRIGWRLRARAVHRGHGRGGFGSMVHGLFPSWTATPGAYALVGMAAVIGERPTHRSRAFSSCSR